MRTTTPILSLLIAMLLFVFFTQPQYEDLKEVQTRIDQYHEATETYNTFTEKLGAKLATKESRSALEVEELDKLVPSEIDETQYLVDLESIAQRHNMLFTVGEIDDKQLSFVTDDAGNEKDASRDELVSVNMRFNVVGTYEQFKSFLRDLERSLTIFEVTQITLKVEEGPFQQFEVSVRTYALPSK